MDAPGGDRGLVGTMKAWVRRIGLGGVISLALLGALEGVLRLTVPVDALLFDYEKPDPELFLTVDTQARYQRDLPPGKRFTLQDGKHDWTWVSNSLGMREDHEIPAEGPGFRVLALGDSWMFGSNATQGQTLPDVLERKLAERHGEAEVMNLGIRGASAWDMLRRYRQFAATYDHDAVLLSTPHNENRYRETSGARDAWSALTAGAPKGDWRLYLLLRRAFVSLTPPPYAKRPGGDAAALSLQDLSALVEEAKTMGKPVYLWVTPGRWADIARQPDRPTGKFYLDGIQDQLTGWTWHRLDTRDCWGNRDDGHPNESGYAAAAILVDRLMAGGESPPKPQSEPLCRDAR